jgi:hypothetical protein
MSRGKRVGTGLDVDNFCQERDFWKSFMYKHLGARNQTLGFGQSGVILGVGVSE